MAINYRPEGYNDVTAYLVVNDAGAALEFAKQVFGATERFTMLTPDNKIGHAEIQIGDSVVMLADASTSDQGVHMPGVLNVYVKDVDDVYAKALAAGGTSLREPADQFYGDRSAGAQDPSGNHWWMATHVEEISPDEMAKRAQEFQAQQ
jgi:PhnB protein